MSPTCCICPLKERKKNLNWLPLAPRRGNCGLLLKICFYCQRLASSNNTKKMIKDIQIDQLFSKFLKEIITKSITKLKSIKHDKKP